MLILVVSFIILCLWICGVSYALCLLPSLMQCRLDIVLRSAVGLLMSLDVPFCPSWLLPFHLGFCSPFYFRVFCIVPWDSMSGLCALWGSLSSFPSLLLGRCTLGRLVWPVIGFPLLGIHPSISIVKLIIIGYWCNHLDG